MNLVVVVVVIGAVVLAVAFVPGWLRRWRTPPRFPPHPEFFARLDDYEATPSTASLSWIPVQRFGPGAELNWAEDHFTRAYGEGKRARLVEVQIITHDRRARPRDDRTIVHFTGRLIRMDAPPGLPRGAMFQLRPEPPRYLMLQGLIVSMSLVLLAGAVLILGPPLVFGPPPSLTSWIVGASLLLGAMLPLLGFFSADYREGRALARARDRMSSAVSPMARRLFAHQDLRAFSSEVFGQSCFRFLTSVAPKLGLTRATRLGVDISAGEILLWMNTDRDLFSPGSTRGDLEKQLATLDFWLQTLDRESVTLVDSARSVPQRTSRRGHR